MEMGSQSLRTATFTPSNCARRPRDTVGSRATRPICDPLHCLFGPIRVSIARRVLGPNDRSDRVMEGGLNTYSRSAPSPGSPRPEAPTPAWYGLVTLMLAAGLLGGCAAPIQYARPIHEDAARAVLLEARYGYGQEGEAFRFSHPLVLTEAQWHHLLGNVRIQPRNWIIQVGARDDGPGPAFREEERAYLAEHLATAFARSRPDEWVLFSLSRTAESSLKEITSGGFFVEGSRLHLVLANYRLPVSMPYVAEQIRRDPLRPSGDTYFDLVAGAHQKVRTRHDWRLTKPLLEHPMELVSDWRAMLQGPRQDRGSSDGGTTPGSGELVESEAERKFRTLDRLLQEGLITEEEYARERQEVLDDF